MKTVWDTNYLIDTHCHILPSLGYDVDIEMKKIALSEVKKIILIGCSIDDAINTIKIAKNYSWVYPSIGIHPEETFKAEFNLDKSISELENLITENANDLIAIGECGFEYFYIDKFIEGSNKTRDEFIQMQRFLFEQHVLLAQKYNLPLIIHCRNGFDDLFQILDKHKLLSQDFSDLPIRSKGIIHSFTDSFDNAKKSIDRGFKIGVNGIITFKNSKNLQEVIHQVIETYGLETIVLETDSPFLTPEPYRGKINSPINIKIIADYLLKLK